MAKLSYLKCWHFFPSACNFNLWYLKSNFIAFINDSCFPCIYHFPSDANDNFVCLFVIFPSYGLHKELYCTLSQKSHEFSIKAITSQVRGASIESKSTYLSLESTRVTLFFSSSNAQACFHVIWSEMYAINGTSNKQSNFPVFESSYFTYRMLFIFSLFAFKVEICVCVDIEVFDHLRNVNICEFNQFHFSPLILYYVDLYYGCIQ